MEIFKRRPLTLACFVFLCTLVLSFYVDKKIKTVLFVVAFGALISSILLFVKYKRKRNALLAMMLSAFLACVALVSSYFGFERGYYGYQGYVKTVGEIEATVSKISYRENFASYILVDVYKINGESKSTKMKLECEYKFPFDEGECFRAKVEFVALEENINGYPEKMIGISKGQSLSAYSFEESDLTYLGKAKFDLFQFANRLNLRLDDILKSAIGKNSSGLSRAILLGNSSALSASEDRDIRYVGVSHLLALSGMHLTILIGNIGVLLSCLGVSKKPRLVILTILTVAYVILTGMQMSMIRSAIMLFIAYLGFFIGRSRDMLTSLFLSVTLICMVSPGAFFDVGLELSFLSMIGMVVFQEPLEEFFSKVLGRLRSDWLYLCIYYICLSFSITFIATLSVLPVIWLYFGETSVIAVIGNFLLGPFADLILMLSPFVIVFFKIPFLGEAFSWCVGRLSDIMLDICELLAKGRGVMVSLRYPFAKWIILAMATVFFIMLIVRINRKYLFLIPAVSAIAVFAVCFLVYTNTHRAELNIVALSDSDNDGFVVVSEGRTLICDISSGSYRFNSLLVRESKELAVCDIETYMLTHYHDRHINTFDRISDQIYIRSMLLPTPVDKEERSVAYALCDIAEEKGVEVYFYDWTKNSEVLFESIKIDIGRRTFISRSVQPITALSFSNGRARLTYIGASVHESALYDTFLPAVRDSEAVVFGAHGPKYKTSYSYGILSDSIEKVYFSASEVLDFADFSNMEIALSFKDVEAVVEQPSCHFVFD